MFTRRKLAVGAAGLAAVAAIGVPLGLTSGGGSIDVFVGSTPTPVATATPASCTGADVTTSTFAARVSGASSGNVLCLSQTADYGTFTGTGSNLPLTITAKAGATPTLIVDVGNGDGNLTVDGGRETWDASTGIRLLNQSAITGTPGPDNVTIRDNLIVEDSAQGAADLLIDGPTTATILIEHNRFTGVDSGTEAAIRVDGDASDVTINRNLFHDQHGDAVKTGGGTTVTVTNNKFLRIDDNSVRNPGADIHSDAVQVNSEDATATIRGNWIDTCQQGITAFDQMGLVLVEHNVVEECNGHTISMEFDWHASTFRHNLIISTEDFNCDTPDSKVSQYPGVAYGIPNVYNNAFLPGINLGSSTGRCIPTRNDHNLCTSSCGGSNTTGSLVYAGGATPSAFDAFSDFCLTTGSAGLTGASDGSQIGPCGGDYNAATDGPPSGEGF